MSRSRPAGLGPLLVPVKLTIAVFYAGIPAVGSIADIDNVIKVIQDALIGIAYDDDGRVADVRSVRRDVTGQVRFSRMTSSMAAALGRNVDFVHVSIEEADLGVPVP